MPATITLAELNRLNREFWNAQQLIVCTENLDSYVLVLMMQSTKNSMRPDAIDPLNWARKWRVFVQRSVRS
jgi:hypothetical protein